MLPPSWLTALCGRCGADPDLRLLLVGPPEVADEVLGALARPTARTGSRCGRSGAAVGMADPPQRASRSDTTVRARPPPRWREGEADALVSAGATGAIVTAAVLGLGRWPRVRRPALVATLPAVAGPVVLLDVGGSLEPGPATLARHAAARRRVRRRRPRRRRAAGRPALGRHRAGQGRPRPPRHRPRARRPQRWAATPATSASSRGTTSPRRPRRRGRHRRLHRQRAAQGHRGRVRPGRRPAGRRRRAPGRGAAGRRRHRRRLPRRRRGRGRRLRHRARRPPAPPPGDRPDRARWPHGRPIRTATR